MNLITTISECKTDSIILALEIKSEVGSEDLSPECFRKSETQGKVRFVILVATSVVLEISVFASQVKFQSSCLL